MSGHSFDDQVPINEIQSSNEFQWLDWMIGYKCSSLSNGPQVDMPYWTRPNAKCGTTIQYVFIHFPLGDVALILNVILKRIVMITLKYVIYILLQHFFATFVHPVRSLFWIVCVFDFDKICPVRILFETVRQLSLIYWLDKGATENTVPVCCFSMLFQYFRMSVSGTVTFKWMTQDPIYDKSTLVQVMAWCRQAASH